MAMVGHTKKRARYSKQTQEEDNESVYEVDDRSEDVKEEEGNDGEGEAAEESDGDELDLEDKDLDNKMTDARSYTDSALSMVKGAIEESRDEDLEAEALIASMRGSLEAVQTYLKWIDTLLDSAEDDITQKETDAQVELDTARAKTESERCRSSQRLEHYTHMVSRYNELRTAVIEELQPLTEGYLRDVNHGVPFSFSNCFLPYTRGHFKAVTPIRNL